MKNNIKQNNRIIAMVLAVIMLVTFLPDINGKTMVYANENNVENGDITEDKSRPNFDVVHFKMQDVDGNQVSEFLEDVIEIGYNGDLVKRVIDGFEFEEVNANVIDFTVTLKPEYEGLYRLVSAGGVKVQADSKSATINALNMDEQNIPIVLEACEYGLSSQVSIGGVSYELVSADGKSIEDAKVSFGKNFAFKLKSGRKFYNDSVDVIVNEKNGDRKYEVTPDKNNLYTVEGGVVRGNIRVSKEITVGYGSVRYTGGFFRGSYEATISANNVYLVSVPSKAGEEPKKYSDLSVPEGSYKVELKDEFSKKYKLVEPDKIYKVIKDKTIDIDAGIEPNDNLNRFNVFFESDLRIVKVSAEGTPVYSEINDDKELPYNNIYVGYDYNKFSIYDVSNEALLDLAIDEEFIDKYEIKSVKYKGTEEEVKKNSETGYYTIKKKDGSAITEVTVVVGTKMPAASGAFKVEVNSTSKKYIEITGIRASKDATSEKLTISENGICNIPDNTDHIYIDVKSNDLNIVPLENIGINIENSDESGVVFTECDYDNSTLRIVYDSATLKGKEIGLFVDIKPIIAFDDNVMKPEISDHSINIIHEGDERYSEALKALDEYEVTELKDSLYVYDISGSENLYIGKALNVHISGRDGNEYKREDYIGKDNITYYYQIFGDKPGKKNKITNPNNFKIILNQANPIIVFTYEVKITDRVYVNDAEVFDSVVNLDRNNQVKIKSIGMASNLSHLNVKDPSTATWKISSFTQAKSDELLKIQKNDAVYFDVNDAAIKAIGYKQFEIERTENGQKTSWAFIINNDKPEVTLTDIDNKTIYAGQEKTFSYVVKGSNHFLTKDNVKIYKATGELANEANIKVKDVSGKDITISVAAINPETDKTQYYVDIVNAKGESLLAMGKKYKLNVNALDSKFSEKNIEYVRSDEDNIYIRIKGLATEVESLYTSFNVSAKAIVDEGQTLNDLYKNESVIDGTVKNDAIIKVPVKVKPSDTRDDKSTSQDYSITIRLQQKKTDESGVYRYAEVKLGTNYSNRALYYETKLNVKALPASKNIYTGQGDIQVATPIFSKESSSTAIVYLRDDKGEIETNNYEGIDGNAYDPETGKLVINIPALVTPGKHVLTFEAYAPNGYIASKASINVNVKIGIEEVSMIKSLDTYYLANKDINIKPVTHYYNATHAPMYESTIKPSTCKAVYRIESDNEYLIPYITINPSNGQVKISKNLSKVYDRIKSKGTSFHIVATANDYPGTEVYKREHSELDREDKWTINITTDGASDYLKNNNEVRAYIEHPYYNEYGQLNSRVEPTDVAIIDKNNKKRTQFTVKEANNLTFRVFRSAAEADEDDIGNIMHSCIKWKVSGPVLSYGADNYGLHIHKVKPGIITVTATAADGSGNGSVTRTFEVKKDDYKLRLIDAGVEELTIIPSDTSYDNEYYAFQGAQFMILPFNDAETEPIIETPYKDHVDDVEHNYKVKISGGVITQLKSDVLIYIPTEPDTKITLINNNKRSDGKKVQEDKVYTIHNQCFDKVDSAFDKVKVLPVTTVANKFYEGKKASKLRFEVTNLPDIVKDKGDGHTGYFLTLAKSYKEKSKFPKPELDSMIEEIPMSSEIMTENGKYYAEIHQSLCEEWWRPISDFVAGTYKLDAYIGKGDITEESILHVLNKKRIETSVTIKPNKLKSTWEGRKSTKIKINGNEKNAQIHLVISANSIDKDTEYFKWSKNKEVAEVRLTGIEYDLDTLNIFKTALISDDKFMAVSSENGNIDFTYKAEDFDVIKNAVVNVAKGKTVKIGSASQKSATKMTAKPDKNGNYDMSKVNPVIRGRFTYEIIGTEAAGYEAITNLTQNFEITLINSK